MCSEYGADDEEVFKCDRATCGLYFHENCLAMYENVDMTIVERTVETKEVDPDTGKEVVTGTQVICRPKFKCPAHTCWCCSGGMPPDPNAAAATDADGGASGGDGGTDGKDGTSPKVGAKGKKGGKKGKKRKKAKVDNAFGEKKEQLFVSADLCWVLYCFLYSTMYFLDHVLILTLFNFPLIVLFHCLATAMPRLPHRLSHHVHPAVHSLPQARSTLS